jgi:hypothetical protein
MTPLAMNSVKINKLQHNAPRVYQTQFCSICSDRVASENVTKVDAKYTDIYRINQL